jgi:hypothetical protein
MNLVPDMQLNPTTTQAPRNDPQTSLKAEFGRLIHAAIINTNFRQRLITNPVGTIDRGYFGESFHFPGEVKEQIRHIRAQNLEEFSSRILQIVETPSIAEIVVLRCN